MLVSLKISMEAVYRLPASHCTYFSKVQERQASQFRMNGSVGCGREFPVCQGLGRAANFLKRRPATTLKSTSLRNGSLRKCSSGRINVTSALHIPGMKLVFVSAEVAPWSKTGGLGDVLVSDTFTSFIYPPTSGHCSKCAASSTMSCQQRLLEIEIGIRRNLTLVISDLFAGGSSTCIGGILIISPRAF